jgi:hypothetical protein
MKTVLNHVAILVRDLEESIKKLSLPKSLLGPIEEFPSEGTKEIYIGEQNQTSKLLLLQPIGDGPYKDAIEKRGPGLHHIALDVMEMESFIYNLAGTGWYLHPRSLEFYQSLNMVFLARPNTPFMIEVLKTKMLENPDSFIDHIELQCPRQSMLETLCCDNLSGGEVAKLTINNTKHFVSDIV